MSTWSVLGASQVLLLAQTREWAFGGGISAVTIMLARQLVNPVDKDGDKCVENYTMHRRQLFLIWIIIMQLKF